MKNRKISERFPILKNKKTNKIQNKQRVLINQTSKFRIQQQILPNSKDIQEKQARQSEQMNIQQMQQIKDVYEIHPIMREIIDRNQQYLSKKIKICCNPKPSPYTFKLPTKTSQSEYNRNFRSKSENNLNIPPVKKPKQNNLPKNKITEISAYQKDFKQHQNLEVPIKPQNYKFTTQNAPFYNITSYRSQYYNVSNNQKIPNFKPTQYARLLKKNNWGTTYNKQFNQNAKRKTISSVNAKDSPKMKLQLFGKGLQRLQTEYQRGYSAKKRSFSMTNLLRYPKQVQKSPYIKEAFQTQYRGNFTKKQNNQSCEYEQMTLDKLLKIISNI